MKFVQSFIFGNVASKESFYLYLTTALAVAMAISILFSLITCSSHRCYIYFMFFPYRFSDGIYHSGRWYKNNEPTPLSRSLIESSFLSGPELDTVSVSSSTTSSGHHRPVSSSFYLPMAAMNPVAANISTVSYCRALFFFLKKKQLRHTSILSLLILLYIYIFIKPSVDLWR